MAFYPSDNEEKKKSYPIKGANGKDTTINVYEGAEKMPAVPKKLTGEPDTLEKKLTRDVVEKLAFQKPPTQPI